MEKRISKIQNANGSSRRSFLRLSSAIAGSALIPAIGAAEKSHPRETWETAIQVRKETGSREEFLNYLYQYGFYTLDESEAVLPYYNNPENTPQSSGNISTQNFERNDLGMYITVLGTDDSDPNEFAHCEWSLNAWYDNDHWNDSNDHGDGPEDAVGITFSDSAYFKPDEFSISSDAHTTRRQDNQYGIAWAHDDVASMDFANYVGTHGYAGLEIKPLRPERRVYMNYIHTWTDISVNPSLTTAFPTSATAISATVSYGANAWSDPLDINCVPGSYAET